MWFRKNVLCDTCRSLKGEKDSLKKFGGDRDHIMEETTMHRLKIEKVQMICTLKTISRKFYVQSIHRTVSHHTLITAIMQVFQ
jgi:hypothetical protein